ncbi:hypothetical protein E2C01_081568 [Portunus trituberculatus]|uniref:Uncharacterized protein n=1 Tax=Portunus trituberculatus TaxID=210409 RepID=A0A5B7IS86_PORTR|nr:hypothetical protein [Portunus trituberculatus]
MKICYGSRGRGCQGVSATVEGEQRDGERQLWMVSKGACMRNVSGAYSRKVEMPCSCNKLVYYRSSFASYTRG